MACSCRGPTQTPPAGILTGLAAILALFGCRRVRELFRCDEEQSRVCGNIQPKPSYCAKLVRS